MAFEQGNNRGYNSSGRGGGSSRGGRGGSFGASRGSRGSSRGSSGGKFAPKYATKSFDKKSYGDRDAKTREIKKALVHRARLRKGYFKLMEKEGYSTEKPKAHGAEQDDDESASENEDEDLDQADEQGQESDQDETKEDVPSKALPPQGEYQKIQRATQRTERREESRDQPKRLTFAERAKLVKDRKEQKRTERLDFIQERRKTIETKSKAREVKKVRLMERTKSGQPKMGPRINNLLDKIKQDMMK